MNIINEGTAKIHESTAGANLNDTSIADVLVNITRPRRGAGITIPGNIPEQKRLESPTLILDPKDKGKGIMKEEPKKKKLILQQLRAAESANDEEFVRKLAAEWEEEEERKRLASLERIQAELEDNEMIAAEVMASYRYALCRGYLVKLLSSSEDHEMMRVVPLSYVKGGEGTYKQAYLATITDSESEPFLDFRETEIPQALPIASSPIPPSDDPYLIVGQAYTPAAIDTESEPEEAPSEIEGFHPLAARTAPPSSDHTLTSSDPTLASPLIDEEFEASEPSDTRITSLHSIAPSDSTTLLSPDHPLTQTTPTPTLSRPLSPGFSVRLKEAMNLSPLSFRKRYRSSYETPSLSSSPAPSSTLPIRNRYQGTSEPILVTKTEDDESQAEGASSGSEESEDEGPDSEGDDVAPEGQQQQAAPFEVTTADRPLWLGYGAARRRALYVILTDSPTLASEDMIHSKEVDMVRMGLRRSSSLLGGAFIALSVSLYCSVGTRSKRMHWMDARALRKKDAFRGERPSGDTICDSWIFDRETRTTVDKRFRCQRQEGTDSEGEESEDEGHDLEGYEAARRRALELAEEIAPSTFKVGQSSRSVLDQQTSRSTLYPRAPVQTPASPEWSSGSLPVSPASLTVPSPVASPATTPTTTIAVDEDEFLEVGAQLELHESILLDHTQRLDAFPPTLLEGHVLALEAWAGHTDAQRAAMWQARYEDHRLIHDLLVQNAAIQRKLQEMRDRVTTLEQERSRREQ
ncbi:hypothetical protein Tco_0445737 [Tanacetum coccineum]